MICHDGEPLQDEFSEAHPDVWAPAAITTCCCAPLQEPDQLTFSSFSQLWHKLRALGERGAVAAKLLEALMRVS